jgi:hypothetical protein
MSDEQYKDKILNDQIGRRIASYPTVEQQLDMLYHDIKANNLANGTWITAIDAVKQQFPKPE